jgi:hypothetical protein
VASGQADMTFDTTINVTVGSKARRPTGGCGVLHERSLADMTTAGFKPIYECQLASDFRSELGHLAHRDGAHSFTGANAGTDFRAGFSAPKEEAADRFAIAK